MPTCFVIQPFDSGKFDKRFEDVYRPASESASLEAYRVDKDPAVAIPIDSIEEGIRQAAVCLADITADNRRAPAVANASTCPTKSSNSHP